MTTPDTRAFVMTVTGPVAPGSLGLTLPHEHLVGAFEPLAGSADAAALRTRLADPSVRAFYDAPLAMAMLGEVALGAANRDDMTFAATDLAVATAELAAFAAVGGRTIVEATGADRGRDPDALRTLARATGLNIVMGAGTHRPGGPADPGALAARIVGEIRDGVDCARVSRLRTGSSTRTDAEGARGGAVSGGAKVRAGVIGEIAALDPGLEPERSHLQAIAEASRQTGAAILIDRSPDPVTQQRVLDALEGAGADLRRVAIAHCDTFAPRPGDLEPLLRRGVSVLFDRLGRLPSALSTQDDHDVARAVIDLDRSGWRDRLLLSHSACRKHHLLAWGGGGYEFLAAQFLPLARMMYGMDADLIDAVTVRNPRRLLTIGGRPE